MSMWIARNKDGNLGLYKHKPTRDAMLDCWTDFKFIRGVIMYLEPEKFPYLKWEDEPIQVEFVETWTLDFDLPDEE